MYNSCVAKPKKKSRSNFLKRNLLPIFLSVLLFILIITAYQQIMKDKFYPMTFVGDTNISFLTKGEAIRKVEAAFQKKINQKLQFSYAQGSFTADLATGSATIDYSTLNDDFNTSHESILTIFHTNTLNPKVTFDITKQLEKIAAALSQQPKNAQLIFDETPTPEGSPSSRIRIKDGEDGFSLDQDQLKKTITNYLLSGKYQPLLPLKTLSPKVSSEYVTKAKEALEHLANEPLKLIFESSSWSIDQKQLLTLLDLQTGQSLLDKDKAYSFLSKITSEIDQDVQEGLFEFNPDTKKVTAFKPSQEGRKLDPDKTFQMIADALSNGSPKVITLPVDTVKPKIATSDVNSLGIKELLGRGISNFAGSIPNRIYNINLTAGKINGTLVAPGQVFSFNQTIGDISAATGFKQAYVIKEGRTVLDDGGGVCQDSTTLFRAVLNAGLPVLARTAHAYRVGYYEQGFPPGLDATVFYPSVDFQFKNDTPAHILIQAYTSGITLYIDLYGSSDGRVVSLTKPIVTNQTPPPPDLRQDDPTLPKGTVKQVDWSAWGATVTFKRTVTRNGQELINETWKSFFKPWQAIYLVGTQ